MKCINCDKIRTAILHGKMAEAAGLALDVFREKMGLTSDGEPMVVGKAGPEVFQPDDGKGTAKTLKKPA
jgi:hypothetical protein